MKIEYLKAMGIDCWVERSSERIVGYSDQRVQSSFSPLIDEPWSNLASRIKQCQACALHQQRTQAVVGVGDQQADLLIVGEAPGYYEDQQGEPFVGRAGQLLNAMLRAIDLNRSQVYIANVLKCRPPKNRDPKPEEVAQCTPFLDEQITLLQPKLILALGRISAHYLLGQSRSMSRLRGQLHHYQNRPVIVSYHPAYLLRNPRDKQKSFEDLNAVQQFLRVYKTVHEQ